MESFLWDEHYVTGLDTVDKQHHQLVDMINRFGNLLTQPENWFPGEIEKVFADLTAYAKYHFTEEESLMESTGVDTRHLDYHRNEHIRFLEEVTQMHVEMTSENRDKAKPLLKFLTHWLAYHILGSDQSMAKQIAAIKNGKSAGDAYLSEERAREGAVEPLLHALGGLFQQVSERNRELFQLNQTLEARVMQRTKELDIANQQLQSLALTDVLTGLPNRRHAIDLMNLVWQESVRENTAFSCMMIDADGFKQINDHYGHDAGDEVLRQLSRGMLYSVRTDDMVCRLGGDEFLVICPKTSLEGVLKLAEKLRQAVGEMRVIAGSGVWKGSVSIGVAQRKVTMNSIEALIKAADEGVYLAKRNGRNCVALAP
jgi:hemerythrin